MVRRPLSLGLKFLLDVSGRFGGSAYLWFANCFSPAGGSQKVKQKILNLPASGHFRLRIDINHASFSYETDSTDPFNLAARMNFSAYEPATRELLALLAKISSFFVDVGASSGLFSLLVASSNPDIDIRAVEPNPEAYRLLTRNLKINQMEHRSRTYQVALAESSGTGLLVAPRRDSKLGALDPQESERDARKFAVSRKTLDQLFAGTPVDLLKIDVEGRESDVLTGGVTLLRTAFPVVITEALDERSLMQQRRILGSLAYRPPQRLQSGHSSDSRNYVWFPSHRHDVLKQYHQRIEAI